MARRIAGVAALALLSVLMAATCAAGRDFYVGGRAGWAPNPAEPFNTWAERNRFQVNDTLVFRYIKGADAVLLVTQGHYDACNATEPALRLDDGDSRFVFHSSGPFFFISPDAARCRAGERLHVIVLAVRDDGTSTGPPPPPKPSASPAPPPKSTSPAPPPPPSGAAPSPRALPASPPKPESTSIPPSSKSSSPPPSAPHAMPTPPAPHPVPGNNASSPSPSHSPVPAPAPAPGTNGTSSPPSPPSPSSAVAIRGGFLACLMLVAGAPILV